MAAGARKITMPTRKYHLHSAWRIVYREARVAAIKLAGNHIHITRALRSYENENKCGIFEKALNRPSKYAATTGNGGVMC